MNKICQVRQRCYLRCLKRDNSLSELRCEIILAMDC